MIGELGAGISGSRRSTCTIMISHIVPAILPLKPPYMISIVPVADLWGSPLPKGCPWTLAFDLCSHAAICDSLKKPADSLQFDLISPV